MNIVTEFYISLTPHSLHYSLRNYTIKTFTMNSYKNQKLEVTGGVVVCVGLITRKEYFPKETSS